MRRFPYAAAALAFAALVMRLAHPELVFARQQQQPPPPAPPPDAVFYQEVSWSPDGSRLGFTAMSGMRTKEMKASVNVMRADGTGVRKLTP